MGKIDDIRGYRDEKGLSQKDMAELLGISREMYNKMEQGKNPVSRATWLSFMALKSENVSHETTDESSYTTQRRNQKLENQAYRIPFFDVSAYGSDVELADTNPITEPTGTIDVGDLLRDSTAAIRVYGNSMIPNYPPGCVIGLAKSSLKIIEPGEVYVIETEDRRIIKRIFYKDDNPDSDVLVCYSDNTLIFQGGARNGQLAYPPFYIRKRDILRLFMVTGVIKRNISSSIIDHHV